jgi:CubicO group peptidase (beta-lactamase class C family)
MAAMRMDVLSALAALGLAACASTPATAPPAVGIDVSAITERLARECAEGTFSGVVVIDVAGERALTHVCGVADVETGAPVEIDARFRIFSTSKMLTALAVMRMAELEAIDLDAPIAAHLEDVPPSWSAVSVRHLLQHTSGLPDQTNALLEAWRGDHGEAIAAVLAESGDVAPATTPGAAWRYNNFGYELLAEAVERRRGQPFAHALQELVFTPAGMTMAVVEAGTFTDGTRASVPDPLLINGYNGSADDLRRAAPFSFVQRGAGAVHAAAGDMLALGDAIHDHRVISAASWAEMIAVLRRGGDDPANPGERGYGLGVVVRGTAPARYVGHDGGTNGYITDFVLFPDQDATLVALSNRGFAHTSWIAGELALALAAPDEP